MLTADQRTEFDRTGLLRLPGAVASVDAQDMSERVWSFLTTHDTVSRHEPATWSTTRPSGFQPLTRSGGLDDMWSAEVRSAIGDLIDGKPRRERPMVLMTFPTAQAAWAVPTAGWHFDYVPLQAELGLRALQAFVVLTDVQPGGGGTLVLAGSHRLVSRYVTDTGLEPRPRLVRAHLASLDPWLAELWDERAGGSAMNHERDRRLMVDGAVVDSVDLRVREVSGSAGDVYLMHSDCFHAIAPNTRRIPRIMATSVVTRIDAGSH